MPRAQLCMLSKSRCTAQQLAGPSCEPAVPDALQNCSGRRSLAAVSAPKELCAQGPNYQLWALQPSAVPSAHAASGGTDAAEEGAGAAATPSELMLLQLLLPPSVLPSEVGVAVAKRALTVTWRPEAGREAAGAGAQPGSACTAAVGPPGTATPFATTELVLLLPGEPAGPPQLCCCGQHVALMVATR